MSETPAFHPDIASRLTGRLVALFVHELNNHFATLNEKSGLAEDILAARMLSEKDKLKEIGTLQASIANRVGLAASLVRSFGEIGRRMEGMPAAGEPGLAVSELVPFLTKISRQKSVSLHADLGRASTSADFDSYALQLTVLALFDNLCSAVDGPASLTLAAGTARDPRSVVLRIDKPAADASGMQPWPMLEIQEYASASGITISKDAVGTFTVTF